MIWQRSPQAGNGCASLGQGRPPWPEGEHLREPGERRARPCEPPLDLPASALAVEAPCAEVLAIVGHDPIAVLSHTRQRPWRIPTATPPPLARGARSATARSNARPGRPLRRCRGGCSRVAASLASSPVATLQRPGCPTRLAADVPNLLSRFAS